MLHSVLSQPVPGPLLNLNAHGLNVQMVHRNLLCSLDATLPSRAAWGHRFQLSPPPPVSPSLFLVIEIRPLSMPLFRLYLSVLSTVEKRQAELIKKSSSSRDWCKVALKLISLPLFHSCLGMRWFIYQGVHKSKHGDTLSWTRQGNLAHAPCMMKFSRETAFEYGELC